MPAYAGFRHAHRVGHLADYATVMPRGNAAHENLQHARTQPWLLPHGRIRRHFHLLVLARTFASQARPLNCHLAIAESHAASLLAVPDHVTCSLLPLLPRSGHLLCR